MRGFIPSLLPPFWFTVHPLWLRYRSNRYASRLDLPALPRLASLASSLRFWPSSLHPSIPHLRGARTNVMSSNVCHVCICMSFKLWCVHTMHFLSHTAYFFAVSLWLSRDGGRGHICYAWKIGSGSTERHTQSQPTITHRVKRPSHTERDRERETERELCIEIIYSQPSIHPSNRNCGTRRAGRRLERLWEPKSTILYHTITRVSRSALASRWERVYVDVGGW